MTVRNISLVVAATAMAQAAAALWFRSAGYGPVDVPVVLAMVAISIPGAFALTPLPWRQPQ